MFNRDVIYESRLQTIKINIEIKLFVLAMINVINGGKYRTVVIYNIPST